ncbi:hypothetical protein AGMMS49957_09760 [Synergistales bacterium]|nr:hypothetical protein AGMMS49957_09760 [Synergistales bacterium]
MNSFKIILTGFFAKLAGIFKRRKPEESTANADTATDESADSLSAELTDAAFVKPEIATLSGGRSDDKKDGKKPSKKRVAALAIAGVTLFLAFGASLGIFFLRPVHVPDPDLAPSPVSMRNIELIEAVRKGRDDDVLRLVSEGADINAPDDAGISAMKAAIALNRVDVIRHFTQLAEESLILRSDNSTLTYAIVQNRPDVVREFLKEAKNLSKLDKNGCTLLSYTISRNNVAIARDLINAGADVNGRDKYGDTPLMAAAALGRPDMVSMLLELGADPSLLSREGETALAIAQRKNRNVLISMLSNALAANESLTPGQPSL